MATRELTEPAAAWDGVRIYTVGHSTRTIDELAALLASFEVSILADIRTMPRSRRNPQFNTDVLGAAIEPRGIHYVHLPQLGGLRRPRKDSPNAGWRNLSFRGYADYMLTPAFEAGLASLREQCSIGTVAIMCAEAVHWRCHRSLVADALVVRGAHVEHITGEGRSTPHALTPFADVQGTRITYPDAAPAPESQRPLF